VASPTPWASAPPAPQPPVPQPVPAGLGEPAPVPCVVAGGAAPPRPTLPVAYNQPARLGPAPRRRWAAMEGYPQSVSINMQPYSRNGAGAPAAAFGPATTSLAQPQPVASPRDFVVWSFFNAMFCNPFCLGFMALVYSVKVRRTSPPSHHLPAQLGGPACCLPPCQGSLIASLLVPLRPTQSHPVPSRPTPSHPVPSHPTPPQLAPNHPVPHLAPPTRCPPAPCAMSSPATPTCTKRPRQSHHSRAARPPSVLRGRGPGQGRLQPAPNHLCRGDKASSRLPARSRGTPETTVRLRPYLGSEVAPCARFLRHLTAAPFLAGSPVTSICRHRGRGLCRLLRPAPPPCPGPGRTGQRVASRNGF